MTSMESLGQRIRNARKAKSMTQEQLASALYVSRQTVSGWENDRSEPDYETLMRIMKLLDVNVGQKAEEDAGEASMPAESEAVSAETVFKEPEKPTEQSEKPCSQTEIQPKDRTAQKRKLFLSRKTAFIAVALAGFLFVMLYVPHIGKDKSGYTVEWFQQPQQREEGKAYIAFTTHTTLPVPIEQQTAETTPTWNYTIYVKEQNGVGVTIDELTTVTFLKNGKNMVYAKTVDVFGERNGGRKSYIGANEIRRIQIRNLADQQMIGAGWLIRGTDDNGNEVCFRAYFPFETM